jgi:hypothetical protein
MVTMTVCREHGASTCTCHPTATHKHYSARTGWREHPGHSHGILIAANGRDTYCYHDGCTYTGRYDPIPVTIKYPR